MPSVILQGITKLLEMLKHTVKQTVLFLLHKTTNVKPP